jgi:hypothetical protein
MGRRIVWFLIAALSLGGAGFAVYQIYFSTPEVESVPEPDAPSVGKSIPSPDEFARLAQSDAVSTFGACLQRYERDGIKAFTATLEKQERVQGDLHEREIIHLTVADEVPAHSGEHPNIRVRMVWESGFQKLLTVKTLGTIYPNPSTDNRKEMTAYTSWGVAKTVEVKDMMARGASRYCICDAGLYRGMLRTYDAWKRRQLAGLLHA